MVELNTSIPSTRRLQKAIQDKQQLEIKLLTSEALTGKLRWQDPDCICVVEEDGQEILIWRQAIAMIRPR